jgi:hypothetical protein
VESGASEQLNAPLSLPPAVLGVHVAGKTNDRRNRCNADSDSHFPTQMKG